MKPVYDVLRELLVLVEREEEAVCEGQTLANPIMYLPISGPSLSGGLCHQFGYHFDVSYPGTDFPRVAIVMVNPDRRTLDVIVAEGRAVNRSTGLPDVARHVKRPDPIFIPGGVVKERHLKGALVNEDGEDIALSFRFQMSDVAAVAEMVIEFLLNNSQPAVVKYL